jgi:hypothetical protein
MSTPLPDGPTFNLESVVLPADGPVTASQSPPANVVAGPEIQNSPAEGDAAARNDVLQTVGSTVSDRCADLRPPAGFVLVRIDLLKGLHEEILKIKRERNQLLPAFLGNPSRDYLDAVQRGAE